MGGYDLDVVVEYYDATSKRWILLDGNLTQEFDSKIVLERLIDELREQYAEDDPSENDLLDEAEGLLRGEYSIALSADYDLIDYLFDLKYHGKRYDILSLQRGLPLDSTIYLHEWQGSLFTFFTLRELQTVNWRQRIDRRGYFTFEEYKIAFRLPASYVARSRGPYLLINDTVWLKADDAAKKALLQYDLALKVNQPAYLQNPEQLERLVAIIGENTQLLNIDSNSVRVSFVLSR